MKISDLRTVTQDHTTIWLQDNETEKCLFANELRFLPEKYDGCEILLMFPEKYPAISSFGITVIIDDLNGDENNG